MNGLQEIQDDLFLDIQNIIEELNGISTIDELLQKEKIIKDLYDKTCFLKLSEAFGLNQMTVKTNFELPESRTEYLNFDDSQSDVVDEVKELDLIDNQILAEAHQEELIDNEEEELMEQEQDVDRLDLSDNEMLKEDEVELQDAETKVEQEEQPSFLNNESLFSFAIHNNEDESLAHHDTSISEVSVSEKEQELPSIFEEESRAIDREEAALAETPKVDVVDIEIQVSEVESPKIEENLDSLDDEDINNAGKIKLANIKGVSRSLFDDENFEESTSDKNIGYDNRIEALPEAGKSPVLPTSSNHSAKVKGNFLLDLNDKIAFTQHLFNNSQVELNQVISRLNEYQSLDEAKEFLSDLYYQKKWDKVDSYAQRLWILVENRFI